MFGHLFGKEDIYGHAVPLNKKKKKKEKKNFGCATSEDL